MSCHDNAFLKQIFGLCALCAYIETHICENEKKSTWPTLVHPGIPEPGLVSLELLLAFWLTHHTETLWQSILDHSYNSCGILMNTLIRVIFWKSINAMGEAVRLFMSGFDTINISLLTKLGRYTKHMPHRHRLKLNFLFLNPYFMLMKNSSYNWLQSVVSLLEDT